MYKVVGTWHNLGIRRILTLKSKREVKNLLRKAKPSGETKEQNGGMLTVLPFIYLQDNLAEKSQQAPLILLHAAESDIFLDAIRGRGPHV